MMPPNVADPAASIAQYAVRSLHAELMLFPKPGLVSAVDNGSHDDMDAALFMRSLFSLRGYFKATARAGAERQDFKTLNRLGVQAEERMVQATGGVNTHRGAIFCLGLLCAAAGRSMAERDLQAKTAGRSMAWHADSATTSSVRNASAALPAFSAAILQGILMRHWGDALALHCQQRLPGAHGTEVAIVHGIGGARAQAAAGMPAVFSVALPALRATLDTGRGWECARIDAFFHLLAELDDSNVRYRGGAAGARLVRACGEEFIRRGGTADPAWRVRAHDMHRRFVTHRLSPGGAADLLAATCFVHAITQDGAVNKASRQMICA